MQAGTRKPIRRSATEQRELVKAPWGLAVAFTIASGCAALGHELLWTRRLIDLLGATGESVARVFGCFCFGLALGAAIAASRYERVKRPWRLLGFAEAGVALLSLPALLLPQWTNWIWPMLGPVRLLTWQGGATKLILSLLVVAPPAVAMGITLPVLVKAIVHGPRGCQRQAIWLYAANTIGGVVGLIFITLIALENWGVQGSMLAMISINAMIAVGCWWVDSRYAPAGPPLARSTASRPASSKAHASAPFSLLVAVAFVSGFGVLALEVVFTQLFQLSAIISVPVTTAILISILLPLSAVAFIIPLVLGAMKSPDRLLVASLAGTGAGIAVIPIAFMSDQVQQMIIGPSATLLGCLVRLVSAALLIMGPAIVLAGSVLPLVLYLAESRAVEAPGRRLGWLLASNGLGGLVGAEIAFRVILPACGVHQSMGLIGSLYVLAAVGVGWLLWRKISAGLILSCMVLAVIGLLSLTTLAHLPQVNDKFGLRTLSVSNGRDGSVAVVEHPAFGRGILVQNQYLLGSTGAAREQARQALLPLLLHPMPHRVALIGLATGSTAAGALEDGAVEHVTALEISGSVVRAARRYFADINSAVFKSPRARVVVEDARTFLAASDGAFDVIVGDLFLPWHPGTGRLFSSEHFRAVRRALDSQGVFCQWLPMHQLTEQQLNVCIQTLQSVFGKVELFRGNLDGTHPLLGMLAWKDSSLDWQVVSNRCEAFRRQREIHDPLMCHPEGVSMLYLGPASRPPAGFRDNTLNDPWLELNAGDERLTGDPAGKYLTHERWLAFAQSQIKQSLGQEPRELAALEMTGQNVACAEMLVELRRAVPPDLLHAIQMNAPASVREDPLGDWQCWPGLETIWPR